MRSNAALVAMALLLAGGGACAATTTTDPRLAAASDCASQGGDRTDYCSYPANVRAFVGDRDACDHWRGEPVPEHEDDPEEVRRKQIIDGINESCPGTDKHLAALKAAYAGDSHVLKLLHEYDVDVESDD